MIITNKVLPIVLFLILFFTNTCIHSENHEKGIEINGQINVRVYEEKIWEEYLPQLEISLFGEKTGEDVKKVSNNKNFSFNAVNPEDVIRIIWAHDKSTENYHVLFPYDREGNASSLSKGTIKFRFRKIEWVLDNFKKRASRAATKGKIKEIDEIVTHAQLYHDALTASPVVDKGTLDRYLYVLLQHICQKSQKQRSSEKKEFINFENIPTQRGWYLKLLNTASDKDYQKKYPHSLINALNEWVVFSRQAYTKLDKWSDRNMPFEDELDKSFKNNEAREYLQKDISKISKMLSQSPIGLFKKGLPLFDEGSSVNMNSVSQWISDTNREIINN